MHKQFFLFGAIIFFTYTSFSQDKSFKAEGYLDFYYKTDFTDNKERTNPYFVSSNRFDAFQVNLAFARFSYEKERYRFVFTPAFGTFMSSNYAQEPPAFRNLLEAYGAYQLSKSKGIWLEGGIFGSPYTNESCISKNHLTYTRSFAPEYVPYYLSGLRLKIPFGEKFNFHLMALNGYQIIQNERSKIGLGTHFEFNPNDKMNLNFTTYTGSTETTFSPLNRTRIFLDFNMNYNFEGDVSVAFCAYYGWQNRYLTPALKDRETVNWGQVNVQLRQKFQKIHSISTRIEYFYDPASVQITPVSKPEGFTAGSFTLGYNVEVGKNALFRVESRQFFSSDAVFRGKDNGFAKSVNEVTANLTFWF
jgi:hypothetical protein